MVMNPAMVIKVAANLADLQRTLNEARPLIQQTSADMAKFSKSFDGMKMLKDAEASVQAIQNLGGATALTEKEQFALNRRLDEALAKYSALGKEAPEDMLALKEQLTQIRASTENAGSGALALFERFKSLSGVLGAGLGAGLSVGALFTFAKGALDAAGNIVDLANKTGLSTDAIQRLQFVANQTGSSIDAFTDASFKLGVTLQTGGTQASKALTDLGLSYAQLRAMSPEEQFDTIAKALGGLRDVQERNRVGVELMGKSYSSIAGSMGDYRELVDKAVVANESAVRASDDAGDALGRFWDGLKAHTINAIGSIILATEKLAHIEPPPLPAPRDPSKLVPKIGETAASHAALVKDLAEMAGNIQIVATGVHLYTAELADATKELAHLTPAQRAEIDAALKLGKTMEELGPIFKLSEHAQRLYASATKDTTKATYDAAAAAKDFVDKFRGVEIQRQVTAISTAISEMSEAERNDVTVKGRYIAEINRLAAAGAALDDRTHAIWVQKLELTKVTPLTVKGLQDLVKNFDAVSLSAGPAALKMTEVTTGAAAVKALLAAATPVYPTTEKPPAPPTQDWGPALHETAQLFAQLAQITGGSMSDIVRAIGTGISAVDQFAKAAEMDSKGGAANWALAATNWVSAAIQVAEAVNAIGSANRNAREQMEAELHRLGQQPHRTPGYFNIELDPLHDQLTAARQAVQDWQDNIDAILGNAPSPLERTKRDIDKVQAELAYAFSQGDSTREINLRRQLTVLREQATELAKQQKLEQDLAAAEDKLKAAQDKHLHLWKDMQAAAEEFKIPIEALGPAFQKSHIDDMTVDLLHKWHALVDNGADVNAVMAGMKDKVSGLIGDSKKFGVEIDAAMRPMLQQMLAAGVLTDDFGAQLTSLDGISWSEDLKLDFKDLKDDIHALVLEIQALVTQLATPIVIPPPLLPKVSGAPPPTSSRGTASVGGAFAAGGFGEVDRPTWFLAGEAGREQYAFSGANRSFAGASHTGDININIDAKGAHFQDRASMKKLAEAVIEEMPNHLKRHGIN